MSNIRAIAREAGVSIATVSRVLNNLPGVSEASRDAVLDAVQRTGYVPEVGRRSTSNIALVYTAEVSLGSPFDAALVNGIFAGLDGSGADLLVLSVRRSRQPGETVTQMLVRKGAQGALLRATAASQGLCQEAAAEGAAILVVGSRAPAEVSCIYSDSRTGSREAIDHLLDLGHRRVAFGTHRIMDSDHVDRLEGSREALAARGVPWEESRVIHTTADRAGGAQVVRRVALMTPRPTAIYLADPLMVIGAYEEARTVGLEVPRDLSIIGFDDGELRHAVSPRLTAVCQDTIGLGRAAATLLLDRIARRPGKPQQEARRCWFEIHESTAPPGSPTG